MNVITRQFVKDYLMQELEQDYDKRMIDRMVD